MGGMFYGSEKEMVHDLVNLELRDNGAKEPCVEEKARHEGKSL